MDNIFQFLRYDVDFVVDSFIRLFVTESFHISDGQPLITQEYTFIQIGLMIETTRVIPTQVIIIVGY
jgi:hypothetical protein